MIGNQLDECTEEDRMRRRDIRMKSNFKAKIRSVLEQTSSLTRQHSLTSINNFVKLQKRKSSNLDIVPCNDFDSYSKNSISDLLSYWSDGRDSGKDDGKSNKNSIGKVRSRIVAFGKGAFRGHGVQKKDDPEVEMKSSSTDFVNIMNSLGNSHLSHGNLDLARDSYENALHSTSHCTSKLSQIQIARSFHGMGIIAVTKREYTPALAWLQESKNLIHNNYDEEYDMDLARVEEDMGFVYFVGFNNILQSRECFLEALRIRNLHAFDENSNICSAPEMKRLQFMTDIVVGVSNLKQDFASVVTRDPSAIGFIYPTVPHMLCSLGVKFQTKYHDEGNSIQCFEEARSIIQSADLDKNHPCINALLEDYPQLKV